MSDAHADPVRFYWVKMISKKIQAHSKLSAKNSETESCKAKIFGPKWVQGSKVNFPECTFLQLFCQLSLWKRPRVDRATRFFSSLAFKENFLTGTSRSIHPFLQIGPNGFLQLYIFVAIHLPFSTGHRDVNESCLLIREKPQSLPCLPASPPAQWATNISKKRSFVFISCNIHYS